MGGGNGGIFKYAQKYKYHYSQGPKLRTPLPPEGYPCVLKKGVCIFLLLEFSKQRKNKKERGERGKGGKE